MTIPDGYSVESLPTPINLIEKTIGNFKYNIENNGKQIQMSVTFEITQPVIPSGAYESLKDFFKKMIAKQTEKIILKKV